MLACALGHAYGPQPERGVFRTTDGGADLDQGRCSSTRTPAARTSRWIRRTRACCSPACGSSRSTPGAASAAARAAGCSRSHDGGATWKRLTGSGLPTKPVGKVAVAIAQSNPSRVYAMIETGDGVPWEGQETDTGQVWRSEDGGDTWQLVSYDHNAMGRAHYYSRMAVAPDDEDEAYFLTASFAKSIDGAQTLAAAVPRGARAATTTTSGSIRPTPTG